MGDDAIMNEGCGAAAVWERTRSSVVVLRFVWPFVGRHGYVHGLQSCCSYIGNIGIGGDGGEGGT